MFHEKIVPCDVDVNDNRNNCMWGNHQRSLKLNEEMFMLYYTKRECYNVSVKWEKNNNKNCKSCVR